MSKATERIQCHSTVGVIFGGLQAHLRGRMTKVGSRSQRARIAFWVSNPSLSRRGQHRCKTGIFKASLRSSGEQSEVFWTRQSAWSGETFHITAGEEAALHALSLLAFFGYRRRRE